MRDCGRLCKKLKETVGGCVLALTFAAQKTVRPQPVARGGQTAVAMQHGPLQMRRLLMSEIVRTYPRLIVSIWGPVKSGKTHLGLSFPRPIHAVEVGETGVEDLTIMHPDWDVRYRSLIIPNLSPSLADHEKLLAELDETLHEAVESDAATFLVDSFSRVWRSVRVVKTEEGFQNSQRLKRNQADYELANDYVEQIIQVARKRRNMNIVLVHRHREVYRKDDEGKLTATGDLEARDYKGMENIVQLQIRTGKQQFIDPKTREKSLDFAHTIELCRFDPDLEGVMVRRLDYQRLVARLFDGH